MDTPGIEQTPAQIAAKERLRAARIAYNNVLANAENYPQGSPDFAALKDFAADEVAAAQVEYDAQFGI